MKIQKCPKRGRASTIRKFSISITVYFASAYKRDMIVVAYRFELEFERAFRVLRFRRIRECL